ncbi:MAG: hypothetical protein HQK77_03245 [Desulfobacterales bacterium]|nr:hypothetical protein [Desulfobacterales bacterium]
MHFGLFFLLLTCLITEIHANDLQEFIESFDTGTINWSKCYIQSEGIKVPVTKNQRECDDPIAQAQQIALDHLLKTLLQVRVSSHLWVRDIVQQDHSMLPKIKTYVNHSQMIKSPYLPDVSSQVILQMNLHGDFSEFVLPADIKQLDSVISLKQNPSVPKQDELDNTAPQKNKYSGLLVDARGLFLSPAMSFSILDESGQQVFGPVFASREYAIKQGMCAYYRDIEVALKDSRILDNPLIIKGLKLVVPRGVDVIISNGDAQKVRSAFELLSNMRKCRVVIVGN